MVGSFWQRDTKKNEHYYLSSVFEGKRRKACLPRIFRRKSLIHLMDFVISCDCEIQLFVHKQPRLGTHTSPWSFTFAPALLAVPFSSEVHGYVSPRLIAYCMS